ncbi:hypothetical protein M422DRAFT_210577 [Sphaerobolus stellatus SS14]|uniref:NF-kappa-B inhibitor-like protein 1 n=1 Tax=Sphaerobolus stellatus (strain SS14) TaxID=990650 RepID=A0A0C9VBW8_SPHS4|nr:hypothetical protein M422DRAFT_210577 [Sphaerobolus stellatus SS14]
MGKLHLKETPEERAERKWRKAKRAERKARKASHRHEGPTPPSNWGDDESWIPPPSSSKIDLDQIRAEIEEQRFKEKLYDAMEDDNDYHRGARLDGLEAHMNAYGHVPNRWRGAAPGGQEHLPDPLSADPNMMTDDEYSEWIREGMWRRSHKAEMEERDRRKAEREARKARERKVREETKRLEREREAERAARHTLRERRQKKEAWEYYEARWRIVTAPDSAEMLFGFRDIPWPLFEVPDGIEGLSKEGIEGFLTEGLEKEEEGKTRKEKIREALLKWHPDKFEGKMGGRLNRKEKEMILEGVGIVARCLNDMMATLNNSAKS